MVSVTFTPGINEPAARLTLSFLRDNGTSTSARPT